MNFSVCERVCARDSYATSHFLQHTRIHTGRHTHAHSLSLVYTFYAFFLLRKEFNDAERDDDAFRFDIFPFVFSSVSP